MNEELFNPFTPEFLSDPYPVFDRLRSRSPVYWSKIFNGWVLTSYKEVDFMLRDSRMSANRVSAMLGRLPEETKKIIEPMRRSLSQWMLMMDPPKHTKLRSVLGKAFSPQVTRNIKPHIESLVDSLLCE